MGLPEWLKIERKISKGGNHSLEEAPESVKKVKLLSNHWMISKLYLFREDSKVNNKKLSTENFNYLLYIYILCNNFIILIKF